MLKYTIAKDEFGFKLKIESEDCGFSTWYSTKELAITKILEAKAIEAKGGNPWTVIGFGDA